MNPVFEDISNTLDGTKWVGKGKERQPRGFPESIPSSWPMQKKLNELMAVKDDTGREIGPHVQGVIATINALTTETIVPTDVIIQSEKKSIDRDANQLLTSAHNDSWGRRPIFDDFPFALGLLRIAALYHDMGKLISTDHHVSRGVHLMRDVSEDDRREIESLFDDFNGRRDFWALLRHHDVYGCLCTGEASLPAISDMASWIPAEDPGFGKPILTRHVTFLMWLNMADTDSTLLDKLGGITTVEVRRYLQDWGKIRSFLDEARTPGFVTREEFKNWAFEVASHPQAAIERITRLVATCYRVVMKSIAPEDRIKSYVEQELQAVHGPRLEQFCYRFARFCKLDYGLRFFYLLMRVAFEEQGLLRHTEEIEKGRPVLKWQLLENVDDFDRRQQTGLSEMVGCTCLILNRIVEEYGHLVEGDQRSTPRLGVDMSGLMRPEQTGLAICQSLQRERSRALWWIVDEIAVWLYGQ